MAELGALPAGCIRFTIPFPLNADSTPVILDIPIVQLAELALRPVRWLKLVAWGVLDCDGDIQNSQQATMSMDLTMVSLAPGEYTFVPAPTAAAHFHFLNLEHTRTTSRSVTSQKSAAYPCPDPAPADRDANLEDRDGAGCVFTGYTPAQRAHVIPQRFSHKTAELKGLSDERNFGLAHHLDPQNTITVFISLHKDWDDRHGFILATEDRFLRNNDIPPAKPNGNIAPPLSSWLARPEPQESAPAYIWQMFATEHSGTQALLRHNERARFKNPTSSHLPSARAVNYTYAAAMVRQFLQPDLKAKLLRVLSRSCPDPTVPLHRPRSENDDPIEGDGTRPHRRPKAREGSHASSGAESDRATGTRDNSPADDGEMDAFEFLFRLTHKGRFLDYYKSEQRAADEAKAHRLDEWQKSLQDYDPAEL